jgi:integrase/recombinase XerC
MERNLETPIKLLSMWLKERIIQNQSEHTIAAYQRDLTDFLNFVNTKSYDWKMSKHLI